MMSLKSNLLVIGTVLFLSACSTNTTTNSTNTPAATPAATTAETATKSDHSKPKKGGQVVETGAYHLEFMPEKEDNGTHLDFYLLKGEAHETVPNAQVTAQVQLPDGTQKNLDMKYDAEGKHYAVLLPEKAAGQYQVKITADIGGEKVNGRFSFNN
ncbi:MAG TPA: hypothetical protein DDW76_22560 [Cyanobacteria bacterium UBA11369]|nr:hypothetical protein [Cyanobacteria bacterium UBA11371]HBE34931.1 hypothetical protein [Cyanobacteria bacterium UBA11368]HBE51482.1 hypothetical protein [Cyanobacteria bacterium UBA11369]